jgi:hypothetical protein
MRRRQIRVKLANLGFGSCGFLIFMAFGAKIGYPPFIPAQTAKASGHEGQELVEIVAGASPQQPPRAPQRPRLHHQQDQPAVQGTAGVNSPL